MVEESRLLYHIGGNSSPSSYGILKVSPLHSSFIIPSVNKKNFSLGNGHLYKSLDVFSIVSEFPSSQQLFSSNQPFYLGYVAHSNL